MLNFNGLKVLQVIQIWNYNKKSLKLLIIGYKNLNLLIQTMFIKL